VTNAGSCLACDTIAGRVMPPGGVIFQNEHWLVDHAVSPAPLTGFLIIKTKRHVEDIADLTLSEHASLGEAMSRTTKALRDVMAPERLYLASLGESVRHVHWLVVPRTAGLPAGPSLLADMWDGRWACSDEEAADVASRVRVAITKNSWSALP
jgi:diadenosine tetraphosphate (Ap4A) HIT family hydrolase